MTKSKWAKITAIIGLVYGVFLLAQVIWWEQIWPKEELHTLAMAIGGIILVSWGIIFFRLKR